MSTREQFLGGEKPPKAIHNYWTGATTSATPVQFLNNGYKQLPGKKYTPSLTATTLTTLLSVTGGGMVDLVMFKENTAGAKTVRIKITIDGTVVFDQTSGSVTVSGVYADGLVAIGHTVGSYDGTQTVHTVVGQPTLFNSSLLIEVVSSTTDSLTDFYVQYRTN